MQYFGKWWKIDDRVIETGLNLPNHFYHYQEYCRFWKPKLLSLTPVCCNFGSFLFVFVIVVRSLVGLISFAFFLFIYYESYFLIYLFAKLILYLDFWHCKEISEFPPKSVIFEIRTYCWDEYLHEVLILYLLIVILFNTFFKARVLMLFHLVWKLRFYTL